MKRIVIGLLILLITFTVVSSCDSSVHYGDVTFRFDEEMPESAMIFIVVGNSCISLDPNTRSYTLQLATGTYPVYYSCSSPDYTISGPSTITVNENSEMTYTVNSKFKKALSAPWW